MVWLLTTFLVLVCVQARPENKRELGLSFVGTLSLEVSANVLDGYTLPFLTLPYATYKARSYDSKRDIYIFGNIRFAAPPVGDLRWAPPTEPVEEPGIHDGSVGGSCFQSTPAQVCFLQSMTVMVVFPSSAST
jgi:Carboxylesterase family